MEKAKFVASGKHVERQRRFEVTKKDKKKKKQSTIKKMDASTIHEIKKTAMDIEIKSCFKCFKEDISLCEVIDWVSCSKCNVWFHSSCVKYDGDDDFICDKCM